MVSRHIKTSQKVLVTRQICKTPSLSIFFSNQLDIPTILMKKKRFASIGGSVSPMTLCGQTCASTEDRPRDPKMRLIKVVFS